MSKTRKSDVELTKPNRTYSIGPTKVQKLQNYICPDCQIGYLGYVAS